MKIRVASLSPYSVAWLFFLWAFTLSSAQPTAAGVTYRGITVSAQTDGKEWATPEMATTLDELKGLGANSIAIHPYAFIQDDGSLRWDQSDSPDYVVKPLEWARDRHLSVMLVPHIFYFGTRFLWRGAIDFPDSAGWNRFFNDYQPWIVHMAEIAEAHGAGVFSIGLEYGPSQKFDLRWRSIITAIRKVYHGKLTYGANWNEVENVPFWDALDYIGVLAYFPLTDTPDPSAADLARGWTNWMPRLQTLSTKIGKPVLFTEIGYNHSSITAAKPWDFQENGGPNASGIQARCIETALELPDHYPFLAGMFFWKWFPNLPYPERETFDLREPALKAVLAKHWKSTVP